MTTRTALGRLATGATVSFVREEGEAWGIEIAGAGSPEVSARNPVRIQVFRPPEDVQHLEAGYGSLDHEGEIVTARSQLPLGTHAVLGVEDRWTISGSQFSVERTVTVRGDAPGGFFSAVLLSTRPDVTWPDVDFFSPGVIYADPRHNGERSPGGTLNYKARRLTIREDRSSAPLFAVSFRDGTSVAILDPSPRGDTTLEEIRTPPGTALVDRRFQFGALGAYQAAGGVEFGFWLPGTTEEVPNGDGEPVRVWRRRYHPVCDGFQQHYQVVFRFWQHEAFRDLTRNAYHWAWETLAPQVTRLDIDTVRRTLIDHLVERVVTIEGRTGIPFIIDATTGQVGVIRSPYAPPPRPRHAIPQDDPTWWWRAVMGFVGKNIEAADQLLREADSDASPRGQRMRELGLAIIDSFIRMVPMSPPAGTGFNLITGKPSLTNPQYGEWFLRAPSEDMRMLMEAYRREHARGREHPEWLNWCRQFADWLLTQQRKDGSFPRSWRPGTNEVVEASGTTSYNPVPLFVMLAEETGEQKYLNSALRAAEYVWETSGTRGIFVGGAIDNPNIVDKEAGMLSLEAFLALYEATGEAKWLARGRAAADFAETWIWIWNVPMPEGADDTELHWKRGVPTVGLQGITTLVAGGVDEYMAWSVPSYAKMYRYAGDPHYREVARLLLYNTKAMLALPGRTYDLVGPGWQQEHWGMSSDMRGFGNHRSWLPWVSTNHLRGITGLQDADPELFADLTTVST